MSRQALTEDSNVKSDLLAVPPLLGQPLAYVFVAFIFLLAFYSTGQKKANVPELNPPKSRLRLPGIVSAEQTQSFLRHSKELFLDGRAKFPNQPYRLYSYLGDSIIIPPNLINEIRNEKALEFRTIFIKGSQSTQISFKLAQEWLEVKPPDMLNIVAQVSTRIFMGDELCRNEDWLNESALYTASAFYGVEALRRWPSILRPLVAPFLAECKEARARIARCREILEPFVTARHAAKAKALAKGEKPPVYNDSLEWFEKECEIYDPATNQITLAMAAIHTTSDLMTETMTQLARHPETFEPLRREVVEVLSRDGLKKTALYNLKLMDSVIKECQRLKPINIANMQRIAVKQFKLPNGLVIPKGERVWADITHMWSDEYYKNAAEFNPYRFMDLRGTEKEHSANFVSTSADHIGFGHGEHACPGRFFASNEIKILLCHILLKYDWKLPEGHDPKHVSVGLPLFQNPDARLLIRRRKEEIDLGSIEW
ncbi:cytochrome P450 [Diaporthe helianthi]|uniref:Cytochrome P450 n=1 Tax=Diaporthe helianthi TaxID=158607 RepID=A0A2P5HNS5_DIAHE|nr:cytochrome P450 [Diaporthe helianthi]